LREVAVDGNGVAAEGDALAHAGLQKK
jgi:hypothetical protein